MIDTNHKIILGSGSPRRKELLQAIVKKFEIKTSEADESAPKEFSGEETAIWVAKAKASPLREKLNEGEILITADTEVWQNGQRFGKPQHRAEAYKMLESLSGKKHEVIGGVCISNNQKQHCFSVVTKVFFKPLSKAEIEYYIDHYQPFDKAGAYGIQEWIGMIGIEKIEGCYYNVVGLPLSRLKEALQTFLDNL